MRGVIVKAISGFYYVLADGRVYECKARGIFKKRGITPLVGDECEIELGVSDSSTVTKIHERKNCFDRPPVANVELMLVTVSAANPDIDYTILDRFLVSAEAMNVKIAVLANKMELAPSKASELKRIYEGIYPVFLLSGVTGEGIDELKDYIISGCGIAGPKVALAGPSGVGKSTLANLLLGSDKAETGEISRKSLRGKNTTRHSELFSSDGFSLFDTPGFTSFESILSDEKALDKYFPEFEPYLGMCRFDDCRHLNEPDCSIRKALSEGKISESRYKSYQDIYKFIKDQKKY